MLEKIRIKVINQLRERENEVRFWDTKFSPKSIQLFNEYMKIAQKCQVNFNGDYGNEVSEGRDRHTVSMISKRCTCRQWNLNGIPHPHAISAMLYNKLTPLSEMSWWYSKEAFLLTYRHKLQPVKGEKFWKVDPSQAIEPPELVKMVGRPKVKRVRQKDEVIKRQGEWANSRKGRVMTCNNCGEPNHNFAGYKKLPVQAKPMKRSRKLIDEPEEINLTAPESSQESQDMNFPSHDPDATMVQQTVHTNLTITLPSHDPDPSIGPRIASESTLFQARQHGQLPSGTRIINFVGDRNGVSVPSNLPYSPTTLTWKGKAAVTQGQLETQSR